MPGKADNPRSVGWPVITLVGVGHVFDLRDQIRRVIQDRHPAVVGVELDSIRFQALQSRIPRGPPLSVYSFVAYVQRRLAREYGTEVGGEMEAAAQAARDVGAKLALIDQDARHVLGRLMSTMSTGEKIRFAMSVVSGLFIGRTQVERELHKFEIRDLFTMSVGAAFLDIHRRVSFKISTAAIVTGRGEDHSRIRPQS